MEEEPRTRDPTDGPCRILSENYRILLDPIGIRRKLSESLVSDSNRKLSVVGSYQNVRVPIVLMVIPTLSDDQQLPIGIRYQRFCRNVRDPIGSH